MTDMYSGSEHVVLDGPVAYGACSRMFETRGAAPRVKFRDLQPMDSNRVPDCVKCLA